MPSISSPPRDLVELLSRRNLASIPRDQQALLESPDSWAVDLKDTPHGQANLPGHVCETTKEAYVARTSAAQKPQSESQSTRPSIPSTLKGNSPVASNDSPIHNGFPHTQYGDTEKPPQSSPATVVSWSPSPERPPPQRIAVESSSTVRETPKAPMGPPPPPRPAVVFPSSDGPEEDLEMELPKAQATQDAPVNRAAARLQATVNSPIPSRDRNMDTPPCAQPSHPTPPVIPNTADAQGSDSHIAQHAPPHEQRRDRRMKPIQFGDRTPKKNQYGKARLAPTKTFIAHVPSSMSTSPSSIIPATFDEPRTPGLVLQSVETTRDHDMDQDDEIEDDDMEAAVEESPTRAAGPSSVRSQRSPRVKRPSPATISVGDMQPYNVFRATYPDYEHRCNGSLSEFVKACYMLDYIRKQRLLREYLYDDFIRAIPAYSNYIGNLHTGQEGLPAIEWFNNLPGSPMFDRMVVNRENIGYILGCYASEVADLSQNIRPNSVESSPHDDVPAAHLEEESDDEAVEVVEAIEAVRKPSAPVHANGAMDIDHDEPEPQSSSKLTLMTSASRPRGLMTQAPPLRSPVLSSTAALLPSTMAATPITRKRPPRTSQYFARLAASSKSNATPRRRTADDRAKLREHFLKRRSAEAQSMRGSSSKPRS